MVQPIKNADELWKEFRALKAEHEVMLEKLRSEFYDLDSGQRAARARELDMIQHRMSQIIGEIDEIECIL
jgi:hypothetical protein